MIGRTLAHYRITAAIGAGGMGEVYRATDTKLGREVALKVLPAEMAASSERLERFRREAKALAALDDPGIVTVYSVEEADGIHFLTMQLVEGKPLDRLISEDGLPVERLLEIGTALADALAAAHQKGIVHRDLKPANIMVTESGRVKVLDFGLARMGADRPAGGSELSTDLRTREGVVMGTLPYMSPEQVSGQVVDHRSDLFSLGAIVYEMACGHRPFAGASLAELSSAILRDPPRPVGEQRPGLPGELDSVLLRCLEKDARQRVQSARELSEAFRALQRDVASGEVHGPARSSSPRAADAAEDTGPSIAVLPLQNLSADKEQEYFSDGLAEEVITLLSQIAGLRVIARTSSFAFRGKHDDVRRIAAALDVTHVLEGSVRRSGTRVRVTTQLVAAADGRQVWSERYDRELSDIFAVQDEIAAAIAGALRLKFSTQGAPQRYTPEAYDAYLKGRYFFNRPSDENLQKAIARFEEAIALGPDLVAALSGLSDAYLWAGYNDGYMTASEARPRAKEAAEKAIALDDNSAEAHTSLAVFKLFYEYDWEGSEAEFRRAIELNPNYAYAPDQLALGLAFQGRFDESIAESRRASELDPLNPQVPIDAMFAWIWKGDYETAKQQARRSAELDPTNFFGPMAEGWIEIQAAKLRDAIPHLEKARAMGSPPFVSAFLAYAYGASGDRARAQAVLEEMKELSPRGSVTPFNLALFAIGQGDHGRAISYLEQAYASDSQWLGWLGHDRIFDPLRSDPRFVALLRKLRFES